MKWDIATAKYKLSSNFSGCVGWCHFQVLLDSRPWVQFRRHHNPINYCLDRHRRRRERQNLQIGCSVVKYCCSVVTRCTKVRSYMLFTLIHSVVTVYVAIPPREHFISYEMVVAEIWSLQVLGYCTIAMRRSQKALGPVLCEPADPTISVCPAERGQCSSSPSRTRVTFT